MKDLSKVVGALRSLPKEQVIEAIKTLSPEQAEELLHEWRLWARPAQLEPEGDNWNTWLINAGRGFGKDLVVTTPIRTTTGWTTIGNLKVGEYVFNHKGQPTKVTDKYYPLPRQLVKFTFSDGCELVSSVEHEWVTWEHRDRKAWNRSQYESGPVPEDWPNWKPKRMVGSQRISKEEAEECIRLHSLGMSERDITKKTGKARNSFRPHIAAGKYVGREPVVDESFVKTRVKTTQQIIDTFTQGKREDNNHSIPQCLPLEGAHKPELVDPYYLGYWLGDGLSCACHEIACGKMDEDHLLSNWPSLKHRGNLVYRRPTEECQWLRDFGLRLNKHIPETVFTASIEQRLAVLQGLMDSDGYAEASKVEFTSTKKCLADGVMELARSLGQKPVMYVGTATLYGKDCGPKYRVNWRPAYGINPFRMKRKADKIKFGTNMEGKNHHRMIVHWEYVPYEPTCCISVDDLDHLFLAGEGLIPTHNTRAGAEWVREQVKAGAKRIAVITRTGNDHEKTVVLGDSGLMSVCWKGDKDHAGKPMGLPYWSSTKKTLTWNNGAQAFFFSAEEPDALRGPQFHAIWADELASWKYDQMTWEMAKMTNRLKWRGRNKFCVTTTPQSTKLIRDLIKQSNERVLEGGTIIPPSVVITQGSTYDNADNLTKEFISDMRASFEGTRLGRQELYAEILAENEDALWTLEMIDSCQVNLEDVPDLVRTVVAVDPATTSNVESDSTGIVVAGVDINGVGYVLGDYTMKDLPEKWAAKAIALYEEFGASRIVYEKNQGGDMIRSLFEAVDPNVPLKGVHASVAKIARAEPVSALYEKGRVKHVRNPKNGASLTELETQMTSFEPFGKQKSPDRYDALVWACTELFFKGKAIPKLAMSYSKAGDLSESKAPF